MNATTPFQLITARPAVPLLQLEVGEAGWISRHVITHAQCTQMAPAGEVGRGLVWLDPQAWVWPGQVNPLPEADPAQIEILSDLSMDDLGAGQVERSNFVVRTPHYYEVYTPAVPHAIHYTYLDVLPAATVLPAFVRRYDLTSLPGAAQ